MANGKHTDNGVDQRIVKFIGRHHVMTIASAATECGPYCANLFYAYIPERNLFVFTSDDRTRHYREMYLNGRVAATIVLETLHRRSGARVSRYSAAPPSPKEKLQERPAVPTCGDFLTPSWPTSRCGRCVRPP